MQFVNFNSLPKTIKGIVQKEDFVGYVRVYYSYGKYSSRLFFKGSANGTVEEIKKAEEIGRKRYTEELQQALSTVCEILFEESNPGGRYEFYDFCKEHAFDKTEDGYMGYAYLAHSVFQIVVSESDSYFCRVYFYAR